MTTVRIEMNSAGFDAILKSPEVQADLRRRAERIAAAAGGEPDFEVDVRVGASRARASVVTATTEGRLAEAKNRALTSALDAGR
ncbi:hypothetical protein [Microbacterium aurantiacum]|uniref:hypothetical protein n=1 Tax=Microbacterium aurantiacum TaxID=162393 RepID=UPI00341CA38A